MARELKRLNIYMPLELVVRVDEYANRVHLNCSAAINMLVRIALQQENELFNRLFQSQKERKGVSMKKNFRNVRLQIFVSSQVDDKLEDLSEVMGMHKMRL